MTALNIALLVSNATTAAQRVNVVQSDPAVRKAFSEASSDVVIAARSVSKAFSEIHLAWKRTGSSFAAA